MEPYWSPIAKVDVDIHYGNFDVDVILLSEHLSEHSGGLNTFKTCNLQENRLLATKIGKHTEIIEQHKKKHEKYGCSSWVGRC